MNLKKSVYIINFVTTIIPIVLITFLTCLIYAANLRKAEKEKLDIVNQAIEKIIDENIEYTINLLYYLESRYQDDEQHFIKGINLLENSEMTVDEKTYHMIEHMDKLFSEKSPIKVLGYGREDKKIFFDAKAGDQNLTPDYDPRIRPWYTGAVKAKDYYISDVYKHKGKGYPMITISKKVEEDGELVGVVLAIMDFTLLENILEKYSEVREGSGFVVLDQKNNVVVDLSGSEKNLKQITDIDYNLEEDNEFVRNVEEKNMIYHNYELKNTNLNLISYISEENLNKEVTRLRNLIISILVGVLLVVTIILVYCGKLLDNSLKKLSNVIYDISNGNYKKNIDKLTNMIGDKSELKRIKDAIKTMAEEVRKREAELKYMSEIDPLTKILNRRSIINYLESEIEKSKELGTKYILIMFDLDKFKLLNDSYGHLFGDEVLKKISLEVMKNIKEADKFGRYGGEEFLILLPDTDLESGVKIAERIRTKIEKLEWEHNVKVTISLGVIDYKNIYSIKNSLEKVDNLLYKAKENGRNRIEY